MEQPSPAPPPRPAVAAARRVVVKVGTRVLTHDDGHIALTRLFSIVEAAGRLRRQGREVILVSSGAVGLGAEALGLAEPPVELAERQACAAAGQSRLMALYQEGLSHLGLLAAQVLLTQADLESRQRYLNLRSALLELLRRGVVPVVNENDVVSTEELALTGASHRSFGDNDRLSALVASKLDAQLLLLLSDVDGVFQRDPRRHPEAPLISRLGGPSDLVEAADTPGSPAGRGGMRSKLEAAFIAARSGCDAVIASGRRPGVLERVLAGEEEGTWIPAREGVISARERWIAWAATTRGTLFLDDGAVAALREQGASLLAAGVTRVEGDFQKGEVVELRDADGALVGRGVVHCDAATAEAWSRETPPRGLRSHHALVHRDQIVLEAKA